MARDPDLPLTDVQWILGHAQLTTTQIYTSAPAAETLVYRPESLGVLFPGASQ
jgi:hypothetical protein